MQKSLLKRAALLCLFVVAHQLSFVSAFTVPSRSISRSRSHSLATLQRPHGNGSSTSLQESSGDKESQIESEKKEPLSDPEEMQRELNAMMAGGTGSVFPEDDEDPDNEGTGDKGLAVYNAAPLFTGVIVTVLSFALTGYGIYAGLTGDDPMSGHPSLPIS